MSTRKRRAAKSNLEHKIKQNKIDDRKRQLDNAVMYCQEKNAEGLRLFLRGYVLMYEIRGR